MRVLKSVVSVILLAAIIWGPIHMSAGRLFASPVFERRILKHSEGSLSGSKSPAGGKPEEIRIADTEEVELALNRLADGLAKGRREAVESCVSPRYFGALEAKMEKWGTSFDALASMISGWPGLIDVRIEKSIKVHGDDATAECLIDLTLVVQGKIELGRQVFGVICLCKEEHGWAVVDGDILEETMFIMSSFLSQVQEGGRR